MREPIKIKYKGRTSFVHLFTKDTSSSYIEKNGFIDLTDISWIGEKGSQRIGVLLPFEYILNNVLHQTLAKVK